MADLTDMAPIYLDYNATTPTDSRVADAMLPFLQGHFGNPSSGHTFGQSASRAIATARAQVADLLDAQPSNIIFTSGGSEANNQAIIGAARLGQKRGRHIVTTAIEHPAVTEVCRYLANDGFETTYVPVDETGQVDPAQVAAAITPQTALVSVMLANNEVGTLQPVRQIADLAHAQGVPVHSDCAQAVGKIPVTMTDLGVDMLSLAGHKLYAPKGIGVLCVRSGLELPPLIYGAGHESGRRAGTENILEIVGLGAACALVKSELETDRIHSSQLRDRLQQALLEAWPQARVNGHLQQRLPNTLSLSFPGVRAGDVLDNMPLVAASAGAACHGHKTILSHVLEAMKVPTDLAAGTLRLSVGRMTTDQEIDQAIPRIIQAVKAAG